MYNTQMAQQQGAFNAPNEVHQNRPQIIFDDEVKEILNKVYPEMINGMINLAIKRFAETKEFKDYFVRKEFREEVVVKEESREVEENAPDFNINNNTSNPAPSTNSAISAVSAW